MGSTNRACGISNANISPGNKVKLFYIVNNAPTFLEEMGEDESYNYYSKAQGVRYEVTDFYRPLGIAMDAVYDDYGRFKVNESDISVQYNLNIIKSEFTNTDGYENINLESLTFNLVEDLIENGRCFLKSNSTKTIRESVEYFAILEDVYDSMVLNHKMQNYSDGKYNIVTTQDTIDEIIKKRKELQIAVELKTEIKFDELQAIIGTVDKNGVIWTSEDAYEFARTSAETSVIFNSEYREPYDDFSYSRSTCLPTFIETFEKCGYEVTDEEIDFFIAEAQKMRILMRVMAAANLQIQSIKIASQEDSKYIQCSALMKMTEALFKNQIQNSRDDEPVLKYVSGYVEITKEEILRFANTDWCEQSIKQCQELYEYLSTLSDNIMVKPEGKYEVLARLVKSTSMNIMIIV